MGQLRVCKNLRPPATRRKRPSGKGFEGIGFRPGAIDLGGFAELQWLEFKAGALNYWGNSYAVDSTGI